MEAYSFSTLRDMLEQPQSHNSKTMESLSSQYPISENQVPHENLPSVPQMFGELYFNKSNSTSSSNQLFLFPPPSSSPSRNHTVETNNIGGKTNLQKDKVAGNGCIYNKKSWGKKERHFPPPISSLKSAKSGEPFVYFRFDENSSTFVPEEIRILKQGLLRASRDSGRLKLNFNHEDEEPEEEEEEDGEEADDGKETSGEEWEVIDFCDFVIDDE